MKKATAATPPTKPDNPEKEEEAKNLAIASSPKNTHRTPWQMEGIKGWFITISGQDHLFPSYVKAVRAFRLLIDSALLNQQIQIPFKEESNNG